LCKGRRFRNAGNGNFIGDSVFKGSSSQIDRTPKQNQKIVDIKDSFPDKIRLRWFITVKSQYDFPVNLRSVQFDLREGDVFFDDWLGGFPLKNQRTPRVKLMPGQTATNLERFGSTTQQVAIKNVLRSTINDAKFEGKKPSLEFILTDIEARADKHPDPTGVPAPLPLLGAAAAFSYSRKLRKSLKSQLDDASNRNQ
jgi:hypothetical protein